MLFDRFRELLLDDTIHSNEMVDFIQSIDYSSLDYTVDYNIYLLYNYISNKFTNYDFKEIDEKLELLSRLSPILYYEIISFWSCLDTKFYIDKIIETEPTNKFERYHKLCCIYKSKISSIKIQEAYKIVDELKEKVNEISEGEPVIIKKLDNTIESILPHLDVLYEKLNINKVSSILKYINRSIITYDYDKAYTYIDLLKNTKINPHFLNMISFQLRIFSNVDKDTLIEFVKEIELLYETDTKIDVLQKGIKMRVMGVCAFTFLRIKTKDELLKNINFIEEFFEENMSSIEHNNKGDLIMRNYYGIVLRSSSSLISLLTGKAKEDTTKKMINCAEKIAEILEKKDGDYNGCASTNNLIDLFQVYNILTNKDKSYNTKICKLYEDNKEFIYEKIQSKMLPPLVNSIFNSLIVTHNVKTLKELYERISSLNDDNPFKAERGYLEQKFNAVIAGEKVIKNFGLNIVEKYEESDEKGCRDETDKLVCTICYDNIEEEKITLIECPHCHKYIGHYFCITKYLSSKIKHLSDINCPLCRTEFKRINRLFYQS